MSLIRSFNPTFSLFQCVESISDEGLGMWGVVWCACVISHRLPVESQQRINQATYIWSQGFLANPVSVNHTVSVNIPPFSFDVCCTVGLPILHACFLDMPLFRLLFDSPGCWLFFFNSFLICLFLPLVKDLKVWRTDPGSIFDIDPLEDNIQSRSLHMLSGTAYVLSSSPFTWLLSSKWSCCELCRFIVPSV